MAPTACPVEKYARDVVAGKHVVCANVRLACERHLKDLKEGPKRGLVWDQAEANRAIGFFPNVLVLSAAQYAGTPFVLQPWQEFVVGSTFGWKKKDGTRRFRRCLLYMARKGGKTETAAGMALFCLLADRENAAQIYSVATTRDQAKMVFSAAERMVALSPQLKKIVKSTRNLLEDPRTFSKFIPLSRDAKKQDGLNVHCAIADEVHEHPNGELIAKLETGMGARRQPLLIETTTAGSNRQSVCYEHWTYAEKVLQGQLPYEASDSWFCFVATLDEGDSWEDERNWIKANPSLGKIATYQALRDEVAIAKQDPSKENSVRRYYMNQWTNSKTRAITWDLWDTGSEPFSAESLKGRTCYGGLDLAAVQDLTSLCLLFPPVEKGEKWKALWWNWCPEDGISKRSNRDRVEYEAWAKQGFITPTPGNTTDFDYVLADIVALSEQYKIRSIGFDRLFAQGGSPFINGCLEEGLNVVEFGQGFISMGPAWNEMYRMLLVPELQHGGNPIARWAADNVETMTDPAGNQKPVKPDTLKSTFRIDPVVALLMAVGMKLRTPPEVETISIYAKEKRGFIFM